MAAFCLCPKNLPEGKLKSNGQISLAEEVSRLHNIDSAGWVRGLLLTLLMQVCSKKIKQQRRKYKL